jgi:hypothetical protein
LFKSRTNRQELIDALDLEIEENSRRSKILGQEEEKCRQKAVELTKEGYDEAAKRWLAVHLLCKQLRNRIETTMADLQAARIQILMQPEKPPSQTLDKVNKLLRDSAVERERMQQAFARMSHLTQISVEQAVGELESYGIKETTLEHEFEKLKEEARVPVVKEEEEIRGEELPKVPRKVKLTSEKIEEKETEKG